MKRPSFSPEAAQRQIQASSMMSDSWYSQFFRRDVSVCSDAVQKFTDRLRTLESPESLQMLRTVFLIVITTGLSACVSASKARFYHADHGVVDGHHEQVRLAGEDCLIEHLVESEPTNAQEVAQDMAYQAYLEGDEDTENLMDATTLVIEGHQLAKHQSACMAARGWHRVEPSN
jgi:hypothetical protein